MHNLFTFDILKHFSLALLYNKIYLLISIQFLNTSLINLARIQFDVLGILIF